jgi:diaminohydroxyphosphoribosylaminopyrimidine deaminase / 5-amino-6-(5-phosphoribosylamino)uracil reductase
MSDTDDRRHLARAIQLARRGLFTVDPNPRVGCVLVRDGAVVGEGWHQRAGDHHAEVLALQAAGPKARGATAYVTLEPCCHHGRTPPCTEALIKAGVARVVFADRDPNPKVNGGGEQALRTAGIEVSAGVLAAEARALNPGFASRLLRGRPYVRLKIASSLDGRTALADGRSQWITGDAARRDVQLWRAQSSVVLTGIGTVLADNPRMNVRLSDGEVARQPLRVVLDAGLRTPGQCALLAVPGPVLVIGATGHAARQSAIEGAGAEVVLVQTGPDGGVHLPAVMATLAAREVNEVWVEAGERLNGALLAAGLVDEVIHYVAARVLGSSARSMFALPPLANLEAAPQLKLVDLRAVGDDVRLRYSVAE